MKVVLLANIQGLGGKNQTVEAHPGYARNYLFARGLARPLTAQIMAEITQKKEKQRKMTASTLAENRRFIDRIDGAELAFSIKSGEGGRFYSAVKKEMLSRLINDRFGVKTRPEQIKLSEPIKKVGEYDAVVDFAPGLFAKVKFIVSQE